MYTNNFLGDSKLNSWFGNAFNICLCYLNRINQLKTVLSSFDPLIHKTLPLPLFDFHTILRNHLIHSGSHSRLFLNGSSPFKTNAQYPTDFQHSVYTSLYFFLRGIMRFATHFVLDTGHPCQNNLSR